MPKTTLLIVLPWALSSLSGCVSAAYTQAKADIAGHRIAASVNISEDHLVREVPCEAAVVGIRQRPNFDCVFVESADRMYWLKYRSADSTYQIEEEVEIANVSGVALRALGLNRQIQLHLGEDIIAFHVVGAALVDAKTTVAIYEQLIAKGVASTEAVGWIDFSSPSAAPMVIAVPAGR